MKAFLILIFFALLIAPISFACKRNAIDGEGKTNRRLKARMTVSNSPESDWYTSEILLYNKSGKDSVTYFLNPDSSFGHIRRSFFDKRDSLVRVDILEIYKERCMPASVVKFERDRRGLIQRAHSLRYSFHDTTYSRSVYKNGKAESIITFNQSKLWSKEIIAYRDSVRFKSFSYFNNLKEYNRIALYHQMKNGYFFVEKTRDNVPVQAHFNVIFMKGIVISADVLFDESVPYLDRYSKKVFDTTGPLLELNYQTIPHFGTCGNGHPYFLHKSRYKYLYY